jgi:hypothetical protein
MQLLFPLPPSHLEGAVADAELREQVKGQTLLDEAAGDWQHVAGLTPRELRKSLASAKTPRLHQ